MRDEEKRQRGNGLGSILIGKRLSEPAARRPPPEAVAQAEEGEGDIGWCHANLPSSI
jgi:hypothetical protein